MRPRATPPWPRCSPSGPGAMPPAQPSFSPPSRPPMRVGTPPVPPSLSPAAGSTRPLNPRETPEWVALIVDATLRHRVSLDLRERASDRKTEHFIAKKKTGRDFCLSCWYEEINCSRNRRPAFDGVSARAELFSDLFSRKVVADFSGGTLSSDGGLPLVRQVDAGLALPARWPDALATSVISASSITRCSSYHRRNLRARRRAVGPIPKLGRLV